MHEPDVFWGAILTSEMSIIEINTMIIAPCLVFLPAFIKCSRSNLSSLRTRFTSSGGRSPSKSAMSKESLPQSDHGRQSYIEIRKRHSIELAYVPEIDGHIGPQKPAAVYTARDADVESMRES